MFAYAFTQSWRMPLGLKHCFPLMPVIAVGVRGEDGAERVCVSSWFVWLSVWLAGWLIFWVTHGVLSFIVSDQVLSGSNAETRICTEYAESSALFRGQAVWTAVHLQGAHTGT